MLLAATFTRLLYHDCQNQDIHHHSSQFIVTNVYCNERNERLLYKLRRMMININDIFDTAAKQTSTCSKSKIEGLEKRVITVQI